MTGLEFISSLVRSLAWPTAVAVSVFLLRRPLAALLETPLKRLKLGPAGFEAEWHQGSALVRGVALAAEQTPIRMSESKSSADTFFAEMIELARTASPLAAIVACEHAVATAILQKLEEASVVPDTPTQNASELAHVARRHGLINATVENAVDGLAAMHRLALLDSGGQNLNMAKAEEYITLTEAVLWTLRQPA